jgi:XRN-Two Binding Domain, XTBD/G-patch domain
MATDWDIESYRKEYECDEHWRLREAFMRAYKDQFTEDELVCLAQVFVNVELLGCRYPLETVQRVTQLAGDLDEVKSYRESRRTTLKRTFIAADDAVAARYHKPETSKKVTSEENTISSVVATPDDRNLFNLLRGVVIKLHSNDLEIGNYNSIIQSINAERKRLNAPEFEQHVKINHVSVAPSYSVQYSYQQTLLVDVSGTGQTTAAKNKSKVEASEALYKLLQKYCYTVRPKVKFLTEELEIKKETVEVGPSKQSTANGSNIQQEDFEDQKIEENNIGFKMLKMLGWKSGSALGSRSDGIVDPVSLQIKIDKRAGFGLTAKNNDTLDAQAVRKLLMDYKNSSSEYDLAFSANFTKEDRATIHT